MLTSLTPVLRQLARAVFVVVVVAYGVKSIDKPLETLKVSGNVVENLGWHVEVAAATVR